MAQEFGMVNRRTRRPTASRVVELWPKMLPQLSRMLVMSEGGQDRRTQNQRSKRFWLPRLATPQGGRVRLWGEMHPRPRLIKDKGRTKGGKWGPWGWGWMGKPVDRVCNMCHHARRSWQKAEGMGSERDELSRNELWNYCRGARNKNDWRPLSLPSPDNLSWHEVTFVAGRRKNLSPLIFTY